MIALRLAKAGYGGGDPGSVLKMRADLVIAAAQYEIFVSDYERAYIELNRPGK